jgi:hypothetical protein
MKNIIRNSFLSFFVVAATMAYAAAAIPPMNVTVSDASGKAAYKGGTNAAGGFATTKLTPGHYVVQLNAKSAAVKGNHYAIVVSAGTKKVAANAVPGEKFTGGGVALKVDVGAGLNITGQVAEESKTAMKNGKKMVWIPPMTGSNMPGRWVDADSAEAKESRTRGTLSTDKLQSMRENTRPTGSEMISPGGR